MPGTIVNPKKKKKDLICTILITFLLTSLQILFNIMDELKSVLDHNNRTFLNKYFFSLSHDCTYSSFESKQTTNIYYFVY